MNIEKIIYHTARTLINLEDKLDIVTIILFCYHDSAKKFSELLYTDDHIAFLKDINDEHFEKDIKFSLKIDDKNVRDCFENTLSEVKKKYDSNGFYKALYEGDKFAIMVDDLVNFDFKSKLNT